MIPAIAISVVLAFTGIPGVPATANVGEDAAGLCSDLGEPLATAGPSPASPAYCQADCGSDPDVSCTGNVSCSAVDQNCPSQRGYVVCDGVYTFCPTCPECENGAFRIYRTGNCCDYPSIGEESWVQKCINETWVTQRTTCFPSSKCPFYP